jgi:hypothetical protein
MSKARKKPGIAFWSAIAALALAFYPLSFGPACWINERTQRLQGVGYTDGWGRQFILTTYRPILDWACKHPDGSEVVYWYAELGVRDHSGLCINYVELPNGGWQAVHILWDRED